MRRASICFIINLFICLAANAQYTQPVSNELKPIDSVHAKSINAYPITTFEVIRPAASFSVKTIPANFYTNTLPFFCKKELQIEKALKFSVKVRMGSVEYTDRLEGKKY